MTTNTPAEYRSKPVTITAVQYDGTAESRSAILEWINANGGSARIMMRPGEPTDTPTYSIRIESLEGPVDAFEGWWVILGTAGEFYPCRDDVFQTKYAPAADAIERPELLIVRDGADRAELAVRDVSARVATAIWNVMALHDAELAEAVKRAGGNWHMIVEPTWMQAVSVAEAQAAIDRAVERATEQAGGL